MWKGPLNIPVRGFASETLWPTMLSLRVGAGRVPAALFPLVDQSSQWAQRVLQGAPTETTLPMSSTASSAPSAFTRPLRLHPHPRPTRWPMDQAPQSPSSDWHPKARSCRAPPLPTTPSPIPQFTSQGPAWRYPKYGLRSPPETASSWSRSTTASRSPAWTDSTTSTST